MRILSQYIDMSSELELLGHAIKRLQSRHHKNLDKKLQESGISLVQWDALRAIANNPGVSAHALAEISFNSDQAFGTLANRLVRQGFVERSQGNGRAIVHTLTETGEQLLKTGRKVVRESLAESFKPLSPDERTVFLQIATKLLEASNN
jgi:DNA-binding MarR family transcriptional regulator